MLAVGADLRVCPFRFGGRRYAFPPYFALWVCLQALVDSVAHFLARFEVRDVFSGEVHRFAGFGVAASARGTVMQGKAAEAPDFYAFAGGQALRHILEHELNG